MILNIFVIRDRATDMYGTPMFMVSAGQAIRSFGDEINKADDKNQLYTHPDDFDLYSLGYFDTNSGQFVTTAPEQIAIGKNLKLKG